MSQSALINERLAQIDIIRGFAVCGIFLVNVPDMIGGGYAFQSAFTGSDAVIRLLYDMFVQTKFYTIFSFLFGISFYLFMQKAEAAGKPPMGLFARRLVVLLGFGLAHAVLLWFGDVLYTYAALGFVLLPFYRRSAQAALIWGACLLGYYSLHILLSSWGGVSGGGPLFAHAPSMKERFDFLLQYGVMNVLGISTEIFGLFALGLYAGKKGWLTAASERSLTVVRYVQWAALLASITLFVPMVRFFMSDPVYKPGMIYHYTYFTGKTMAVFYVCTLLRLMHRFGTGRFIRLANVGRMAFTNYLSQTIVTMGLLLAFRQATEWPMWAGTVYCCAVLAAQLVCSTLWLQRYKLGPLEWLWRAGTYGTLPALRQSAMPATTTERSVRVKM